MSRRTVVRSPKKLKPSRIQLTPSAKVKRELKAYAQRVDPYLAEVFVTQQADFSGAPVYWQQMLQYLQEFCLRGGKRLRPYLVNCGYQLLSRRQPDERIVRTSVLPELIHAFLLIHDDIMDESETRRGELTIHKRYERERVVEMRGETRDAQRFGESMGILAGDLMYTLTWQTLNRLALDDGIKVQLMDILSQSVKQTIAGQGLDIRLESKTQPTVDEVLTMYRLKTAGYTFVAPLKMGAILAGATDEAVAALVEYAANCGVAFQVQDDVLGFFGDEKKTGKSALDDLKQGKRTVLIVKALELADGKQLKILKEALGNVAVTDKTVEMLRQVVLETGALRYCENVTKEHLVKAKRALRKLAGDQYSQTAREKLSNVADFVVQRSS